MKRKSGLGEKVNTSPDMFRKIGFQGKSREERKRRCIKERVEYTGKRWALTKGKPFMWGLKKKSRGARLVRKQTRGTKKVEGGKQVFRVTSGPQKKTPRVSLFHREPRCRKEQKERKKRIGGKQK